MLEDVRDVCSFPQPLEEATRFLPRAMMLGKGRYRVGKPLVESGYLGRAYLLEGAQLNIAGNDWGKAPVVWASQRADPLYFQLVRVDL